MTYSTARLERATSQSVPAITIELISTFQYNATDEAPMTETFQLHPQLAADTTIVTDGPLSHVLLMNDARYPWLILVPKRANLVDYDDLSADERKILGDECAAVSSALKRRFKAHKTNVAMLGNMVPQLHCHVVARFTDDAAWPGPIWGVGTAEPYDEDAGRERLAILRADLISAFKHL
ncbi:HIT domain-containing protein [Thalassospira alkalitolerans]|uniref:HIT domain-containing protein n=1 Tax=Thalassospira alkalitolerans TaxID=1293890 RepID=UPI003AA8451E